MENKGAKIRLTEEVRSVGDGLDDLKVGLKFLFTIRETTS
jgi:hypothetical protein